MNDSLSITQSVALRRRLSNDSGADKGRPSPAGLSKNRNRRQSLIVSQQIVDVDATRMWANAQRDGRPAEYRWRHLFNAAKFG